MPDRILGRYRYAGGAIFVLIGLLMLTACQGREPIADKARTIYPLAGEGIAISGTQTLITQPQQEEQFRPRLPLPDNYVVGQLIEYNLDEDEGWEQIVVFKRRDDQRDSIRIQIIDYHPVRNSYVRAWEGETGANNVGSFNIEFADLTGNHDLEIIFRGDDSSGQQTIDVFHRQTGTAQSLLAYNTIASFVSPVSIEIEQIERSAEYESLDAVGAANPILVYDRVRIESAPNENAPNESAPNESAPNKEITNESTESLIKSTYLWDAFAQRYVENRREEISDIVRSQEYLEDLLKGDVDNFNRFIGGPWLNEGTVIFFDIEAKTIILSDSLTQVAYVWLRSRKTTVEGRPALSITMHNLLLPNIVRNTFVSALSNDSLAINIEDEDDLNGIYYKLESLAEINPTQQSRTTVADIEIDGVFTSETGVEILFNAPFLTMREQGRELSGGYLLYELDSAVLEINIVDTSGLLVETRAYIIEYAERNFDERSIRTLRLTPADIHIDGVRSISGTVLNLEQIEDNPAPRESNGNDAAQVTN